MDTSVFFKNGKFVKQSVRAKRYDAFFRELAITHHTTNRSELLWLITNERPVCRQCGNPTKFKNYETGYRHLCSDACARKDTLTKQRRVQSIKGFFQNHHMLDNPMQLSSTKCKVANTNLEKYGTPWYVQTNDFKNASTENALEKWGCTSPQQSQILKDSIRHSIFSKYGRSTARDFTENRINRIAKVEQWCIDLTISHEQLDPQKVMSEHKYTFYHTCGNTWQQAIGTVLPVCSACHRGSKVEKHIKAWIKSLAIPVKFNDRTLIKPLELDIVLAEHNLAIEVNGLYWHHDDSGRPTVRAKTDLCAEKGIQLISIWEHEWYDEIMREKIKSVILAKLGMAKRIFARKTSLRVLDLETSRNFLNQNHVQGWASASETIGLFHGDDLVMVMSTGRRRWAIGSDQEIIRLCTKMGLVVVGGFTKLLSYYRGQRLLSYCDRRFGNGRGYEAAGFTRDGITKPNYLWWKNTAFLKRGSTTRKRLPVLLGEMFHPDLSENDNMRAANWKKLSDAGNLRYVLLPDIT